MKKYKSRIQILSNKISELGLNSDAAHILALFKAASTYGLPADPQNDIGLMTIDQFLIHRNPDQKQHESYSYDLDISQLNKSYPEDIGFVFVKNKRISIKKFSNGIMLVDKGDDAEIIGIILGDTLYYKDRTLKNDLERLGNANVYDHIGYKEVQGVKISFSRIELVKYLKEYIAKADPVGKNNFSKLPHLIQNIILNNSEFSIRSEMEPEANNGVTIAILDRNGIIVAQASNEWGATLIVVAKEYRGYGLGKILGKIWYEKNPSFKSGGFTASGERNAISIWKNRVSDFLSNGWYSELIKKQELSKERLDKIINDWKLVGGREKQKTGDFNLEASKPSGEALVYSDGTTFIIYDKSFLDYQDEKYIYGYGFLRSSGEKIFYYRIDYVNGYKELATKVALQMARNNNESIFKELPGDHLPIDGFEEYVSIEDGDITVIKDLIDLRSLSLIEEPLRKNIDKFGEIKTLLFEMAESKDWPN